MKEISLNYPIKSKESDRTDPSPSIDPIIDMKRLMANREKVFELIKTCNIALPRND